MHYQQPAVPWPDDDQYPGAAPTSHRNLTVIAVVTVSIFAVALLIAAIIFAFNLGRVSIGQKESTPQTASGAPTNPSVWSTPEAPPTHDTQQARLDPSTYTSLSPRDFALLAKNPEAWKGRKVVVYGLVTQFDAATGPSSFRADTDALPHTDGYDYDQNTWITARDPGILTDVRRKGPRHNVRRGSRFVHV